MTDFLRDLAIAKFPRFGIIYYIQLDASSEPEIHGGSCKVPLKFYDGKTTPPQHITDKAVKLPLWKWGEVMDIVEAEMFADVQHIVAVELTKRRAEDEYGHLEVRLDKQASLDANLRDAPQPTPPLDPAPGPGQAGPSKPAAGKVLVDEAQSSSPSSERGQPQAGVLNKAAHIVAESIAPAACPLPDTHTGPVTYNAATEDTFEGFYCESCGERVG